MKSSSDPADGVRPVAGGLAFVRQHPEMFRQLAHDGPSAAALLVEVTLRKSASRVQVGRAGQWYWVWSDNDWLSDLSDRDPFATVTPFPALGPNAIYPEVIIAAFSSGMVSIVDGNVVSINGQLPDVSSLIPDLGIAGRTVLFRYDSD